MYIFGVTRSINDLFGSFLQGIGKPSILTKAVAIQLTIIILIYPLTFKMGIIGTSIVVSFSNAFIMFMSLIILENVLIINIEIGKLIILIFIGFVFYLGFILLFSHFFLDNIRKNLKYYSGLLLNKNFD